ncbi:MAG: PAS domain S-box protein [Holophagales bacterium]|nr:PAS domain S-box protein [Holophagales bacterium]
MAADWSLAAFDSSPIGMAVTAPAGHLIRVNRAFSTMLGYTLDELADSDWKSLTHPDDVDASWEMVRRLVDGPSSSGRIEKRYLAKDGRVVRADVSTSLLRDGEGRALYLVTHVVDVTARREAEEERQRTARRSSTSTTTPPAGTTPSTRTGRSSGSTRQSSHGSVTRGRRSSDARSSRSSSPRRAWRSSGRTSPASRNGAGSRTSSST